MKNTEEVHSLTEKIYKNLATKFTPQAKLVLINGKAFHKSLLATSSAARVYIESMGRLGHDARTSGNGGTEEIGQAIFRLAEVYKEIQMKFEDCTKALFAEIVLPLEQKLDNEFKNANAEQRKYHQGHKEFLAPYMKALNCLEKFSKKNQSKGVYDEEKEAPLSRAVFKYQEKLDEFRLQGLKLALLEERKCYCFILSHLTNVAAVQLKYHDKGLEYLTDELPTWRQLSLQPHVLPRSADEFLRVMDPRGLTNGGMTLTYGYSGSMTNPYNQSGPHGDYLPGRPPSEYSLPSQPSPSQVLHNSRAMLPPPPPQGVQVKALYSHVPNHESHLKFNPGDIMTLIGDPSDGWSYAYNPISDSYGWLPLAYVESVPKITHYNNPPPRAKSISDLKEHSLAALSSNFSLNAGIIHYNVSDKNKRPASVHEPGVMKITGDTFQTPTSETSSLNSSSSLNLQVHYTPSTRPGMDIYQSLPGESQELHSLAHGTMPGGSVRSSDGHLLQMPGSHSLGHLYAPPSPPLPPPPILSNIAQHPRPTGGSVTVPNTPLTSSRPRSNSIGTYLPHALHTANFNIPPPPNFDAPLPPPVSTAIPQTPGSRRLVPPPVSQKTTSLASMASHGHINTQTPLTSKSSAHPPPPPPASIKNPFSGASLKKTKTNDRSAPRLQ